MVKLKRLKIEKYRNLKPGTELHFRDSLNVLLGRNGTGKTTLLNLVVQLLRWDFSQMLEEAFALEYDLESPEGKVMLRVRNDLQAEPTPLEALMPLLLRTPLGKRSETSGELWIALPGEEEVLSLAFAGSKLWWVRPDELIPRQVEHSLPLIGEGTLFNMAVSVARLFGSKGQPREAEGWGHVLGSMTRTLRVRRFDESLGYLERITNAVSLYKTVRLDEGNSYATMSEEGEPSGLASHVSRTLKREPGTDEVKLDANDKGAAFLQRVVALLEYQSAQLRLQRTARTPPPMEQFLFGNLQFDFTRRDGSVINHSLLSYGQKRLLAFYYYQACNPECVVADELVNGMHHEWIDACLEELGDRQAFLTSQNPLLLDYLSFESAEEVRSSFVLCRSALQEDREQMVWENMTAEDSEGFFKAYQVAIQHVSELLRTRGLW
ncbi:AAA family ATPase [Archangium violaceum]|uniref:AAA family ATPase n=1 Tax=Archangium violaceum TaxID=83451 RepID=UPI002B29BABF|nr:AAA family ATPase [Archangium gephyra]